MVSPSLSGPIFSYILGVKELTAQQKEKAVWTDIDNAFSTPVTRSDDKANYAPTQILAELFRSAGYDAIAYKSHFGDEGYNIANI
ncbi:RES family NAD+ phosphorylase [Providencia hangzhouensis]